MRTPILDRLLFALDVDVEAIAICEVRKGYRLVGKPQNAISVHYVLAGSMHLAAGNSGTVICAQGSLVVVPPNVGQKIASDAKSHNEILAQENCSAMHDGLLLVDAAGGRPGDLRVMCGLISPTGMGSFGVLDNLKAPIIADPGDTSFVRHAYGVMLDEIANPGLGTRALLRALMKSCLVPVLRRHFACPEKQSELLEPFRDPRLGKAAAAIFNAPAQPHSVASLAAIACMSRSAFAKEFAARFGMTPMEFVINTRLRLAAGLLRSTGLPVKQVAASVGFSSRSHFSRAFRESFGADPSAFRAATPKTL